MALLFKDGVKLIGLHAAMLIAVHIVQEEFARYGLDTVITSGNDSTHSTKSLHYKGRAFDFRTRHAVGVISGIYLAIKKRLTPIGFDVLYENPGGANQHLHIEYDPK